MLEHVADRIPLQRAVRDSAALPNSASGSIIALFPLYWIIAPHSNTELDGDTEKLVLNNTHNQSDSRETPSCTCTKTAADCNIGKLIQNNVNVQRLNREQIYKILTHEPNKDPACYPRTCLCESDCFRQFQPTWVKKYPWIHYSSHVNGIFCRACVIFAPEKIGGQFPGKFMTKEFNNWINISQKLNAHSKKDYHLNSLTKMDEFLSQYQTPSKAICSQLSSKVQKLLQDNKGVIESLFKITLLCGKQGIPLRGHRDDNVNWIDEKLDLHDNQGNFIELVRFRAETDDVLQAHLRNAPKNACYTSKIIIKYGST